MEREAKLYGLDSWKLYCHTDPAKTGRGFQLDDEATAYFYDVARELGVKLVSVHKGFASQSRTFGHLANPKDVERAALDNPDFTFVIYHSAMKHGPHEPSFKTEDFYDPATGDFEWHDILMDIKRRNPELNNVYAEIGTSFGLTAVANPVMTMHLMGKNIKYYGADHVVWGTDCIWWGSPQWIIDSFKRFQICDEICERFGYEKITKEDKAKIRSQRRQALRRGHPNQTQISGHRPAGAGEATIRGGQDLAAQQRRLRLGAGGLSLVPPSHGLWAVACFLSVAPSLSHAQQSLDPAVWGSNHVGRPVPDYIDSEQCLFRRSRAIGTSWLSNRHGRTTRVLEREAARPRRSNP